MSLQAEPRGSRSWLRAVQCEGKCWNVDLTEVLLEQEGHPPHCDWYELVEGTWTWQS